METVNARAIFIAISAGFVAFGVAYLASDLFVEYHGKEYAATVVNGAVVTLIIAYAIVFLAIGMPSTLFYGGQGAFVSMLGGSASIVLASVVALTSAQHLDVRLFSNLKTHTGGCHRWPRNYGSTVVSQGVDTVVFITLGFAIFPHSALVGSQRGAGRSSQSSLGSTS